MKRKIILLSFIIFSLNGCSVIQQIRDFAKLKFKIASVGNFNIAGIDISRKTEFSDFKALELLKLSSVITDNKLPATFTLNLEAKNPNKNTDYSQAPAISLNSLPWTLYINEKETISGNISKPVSVPGNNAIVNIPLDIQLDLIKIFEDGTLQNIANTVLKVGGANKDLTKIKIVARPVIGTPIGEITYPDELTIINTEFK
jgi:hypothetical protein